MANEVSESSSQTKWATTSLICGIVSVVLPLPFIGIIIAIFAIVGYYKQKKIVPSGMATAGLILGIIGLVVSGIFTLIFGLGAFSFFSVLSPNKFLGDSCKLSTSYGISCEDYNAVHPDIVNIIIKNFLNQNITIATNSVVFTYGEGVSMAENGFVYKGDKGKNCTNSIGGIMGPNQTLNLVLKCPSTFKSGDELKGFLSVNYETSSEPGFTERTSGRLIIKSS